MKASLAVFVALAVCAAALLADPTVDQKACGIKSDGPSRLCDPEGYLSKKGQELVNSVLLEMEKSKHDACPTGPNQVAVAIVSRMDVSELTYVPHDEMERVSVVTRQLHDHWGLGQRDCNNGALMYIAVKDRKMFISTGRGLMDTLTDEDIDYTIDAMKPYLKEGKYDAAVLQGVNLVKDYLNGVGPRMGFFAKLWRDYGVVFIWIFIIVGMIAFQYFKDRSYNQCKTKLGLIERQAKAMRFDHSACPICLEEFSKLEAGTVDETKRQILDCGHAFHISCLEDWWKQRQSCPVCRHRIDDEDNMAPQRPVIPPPTSSPSSSPVPYYQQPPTSSTSTETQQDKDSAAQATRNQHMEDQLRYQRELDFHLMRLHFMYPTYVTRPMVTTWRTMPTPVYTTSPEFAAVRPSAQSSSGRSGGRSGFGGGSSRGGGGRGGSW